MSRLLNADCNPDLLSPLTLAFIGDGVFDLFIREHLVCEANRPVGKLNKVKVDKVCCQAQSQMSDKIISILSEQELAVFKRGRNAKTSHTPKNASNADYHNATGIEALFGYLYLNNQIERLRELIKIHLDT